MLVSPSNESSAGTGRTLASVASELVEVVEAELLRPKSSWLSQLALKFVTEWPGNQAIGSQPVQAKANQ